MIRKPLDESIEKEIFIGMRTIHEDFPMDYSNPSMSYWDENNSMKIHEVENHSLMGNLLVYAVFSLKTAGYFPNLS